MQNPNVKLFATSTRKYHEIDVLYEFKKHLFMSCNRGTVVKQLLSTPCQKTGRALVNASHFSRPKCHSEVILAGCSSHFSNLNPRAHVIVLDVFNEHRILNKNITN